MQEIEREIIDQVRGRGAQIDAKDFSWNRGQPLAKLPSGSVYMEVRVGSKQAIANWERTQLEDCWDRVDRPEVAPGDRAHRRDTRASSHPEGQQSPLK